MNAFIDRILFNGPVITDGAWGTELQLRGLAPGEFPDLWNLSHPDRVSDVARAYVEAGSRVILTNTFGANRLRMSDHSLGDRVNEINRMGVQLSRKAAEGKAFVFASLGPSGKMLLSGDTTVDELRAAFDEQAEALADGGADAIVVETMCDLDEARQAVQAAKATGLPVVACMVFDSGRNKDRTMMGSTPEQAVEALAAAGADVIGANCGQGIAAYAAICRRLKAATGLPIWVKANAGQPILEDGKIRYPSNPEDFAARVPELVEAGAGFIGGCCGSSPAFVRAMKRQLCQCHEAPTAASCGT